MRETPPHERFLTVREVADRWRVTERTVRTWIDKGAIEAVRKGGVIRIAEGNAMKGHTPGVASSE